MMRPFWSRQGKTLCEKKVTSSSQSPKKWCDLKSEVKERARGMHKDIVNGRRVVERRCHDQNWNMDLLAKELLQTQHAIAIQLEDRFA